MATITLGAMRPVGTISGNAEELGYFPEAASQTYKEGSLVYLNSGKITICGSDPGVDGVLGIAAHNASGTTNNNSAVYIANRDTIFEGNCYYDGVGDSDDAPAITNVGGKYGVVLVGTNWHVDLSETSSTVVQIRSISPKDAAGDIYGRVHFQILSDVAQLGASEKTA